MLSLRVGLFYVEGVLLDVYQAPQVSNETRPIGEIWLSKPGSHNPIANEVTPLA